MRWRSRPTVKLVLTGSWDKTARLWEAACGKPVATLSGHEGAVLQVVFSPDGKLALTSSAENTARLWPVLSGTQALVETAKSTVPRCLTPAQRQRFLLAPTAPRWCFTAKLWPYDEQAKIPPAPPAWDERLLAAWDWATGWVGARGALAKP